MNNLRNLIHSLDSEMKLSVKKYYTKFWEDTIWYKYDEFKVSNNGFKWIIKVFGLIKTN